MEVDGQLTQDLGVVIQRKGDKNRSPFPEEAHLYLGGGLKVDSDSMHESGLVIIMTRTLRYIWHF